MLPSSVFNLEPILALNEQEFPSISEITAVGAQAPQQLIPQDITSRGLLCVQSLSLPWILWGSGSQKCAGNLKPLDSMGGGEGGL